MSDDPAVTFPSSEKRGDNPCAHSDLLMKIAVARWGEPPLGQGPVATALMQHRIAQVQLMLDAIESVAPKMAISIQYVVRVEQQLVERNLALALIQQSIKDIVDGKERMP